MIVICIKAMASVNSAFEPRKWILKCYCKTENLAEVQWRWRNEFGTPPLTRLRVTKIRDKFEVDGKVQNVNKGRSGKPHNSTHNESVMTVLQAYTQSPKKYASLRFPVAIKIPVALLKS
jgi:hypothetical protein